MTTDNIENTGTTITPGEGAPSPIPAGPATVAGEAEAAPTPAPAVDSGPLTPENLAERAAKAAGRAKNPQTGRFEKGEKGPQKTALEPTKSGEKPTKGSEKPGQEAPVAAPTGESGYKAPTKFTALGKEYDLPKWAQSAMTSPELEKEIRPLFEKVQAFDHVQTRHKELHTRHVELEGTHNEVVGGIEDLKDIYSSAVESGNLLLLDDFFKNLQIPREVILNYALQHAQLMELDPAQQQLVLGQVQGTRETRALRKQNAGLSSTASSSQSRAMELELNTVLAKPDIAPIVQAFDSAPGRKPGAFWKRVQEHGEYTYLKQGRLLPPAEAVAEVIATFGLGQAAPAPQGQPAAAAPAAAAPPAPAPQGQVPVVTPQAHRVPTIPAVAAGSGSPTPQKPKSIDELRKIRQEKYGS